METNDKHRFDGKEDKGYLQKPFDENNDRLSQIDNESARLAEEREDTKTFRESDPTKRGEAFPNVPEIRMPHRSKGIQVFRQTWANSCLKLNFEPICS